MNKYKTNILIIVFIILNHNIIASNYIVKIKTDTTNILTDSGFDINGFDKDGFHKDTKTEVDNNGYNKEGIRNDIDSNISANISNKLITNYETNINQQDEQGDFIEVSGIISFNKNISNILNVDSKNVILKSQIISSPFSNGNQIIKNNLLYSNIYNIADYDKVDNVYENVSVTYYTDWTLRGTSTATTTNPSYSSGQTVSSRNWGTSPYKYVANESSYYRTYELNGSMRYQYNCDYYEKSKRTRTEQRLVSSTTTKYTEINNVLNNDVIEVFIPIKLEVNIDSAGWQNIPLDRNDITKGEVSFSISNILFRSIDIRISDSLIGEDYTTLNNIDLNFQNNKD
jgi:hypothetical protein